MGWGESMAMKKGKPQPMCSFLLIDLVSNKYCFPLLFQLLAYVYSPILRHSNRIMGEGESSPDMTEKSPTLICD
jgi:hypothetical protein